MSKISTKKILAKESPVDMIQVEIGDSKQPDFKPQFKVMRWDNEVNFSMRAKEHPDAVIETDGDVIKYKTPDYEVHQYEKPEAGEDGGFEFEWVLPEKPKDNVLEASIQTKGLDFLYQPPLTQEEIDQGTSRPENVVGSYAVYHSTKGTVNRDGLKDYKTGKAFHIYRPKAIDANGNEVWCDLAIDIDAGMLLVTVPQEFLDKALYPVLVDPTFGYTSAGASLTSENADSFRMRIGNPGETGTLTSISFSGNKGTASAQLAKATLYIRSDASLVSPQSDEISVDSETTQWWDLPVSGGASLSSQDYDVLIFFDGIANGSRLSFDTGGVSGDSRFKTSGITYPTFPDPYASVTNSSNRYSIYATYTSAGGGSSSISPSVSPSASLSPSSSLSPSFSSSASLSPSASASGSLSPSSSSSLSLSPSASLSPSGSISLSPSPSSSLSPSASSSRSLSPSASLSQSASSSRSLSPSASQSPSRSASRSLSPSASLSPSGSSSRSLSPSASSSASLSPSGSASASASLSGSSSLSPSASISPSSSASAGGSEIIEDVEVHLLGSASASPSVSPTESSSVSPSESASESFSPSASASASLSPATYVDKYVDQSTDYTAKYSDLGNSYTDKYSLKNTEYVPKYIDWPELPISN